MGALLGVINAFGTDTVTVTRTTAEVYTDGVAAPGTASTFTTKVIVEPATGMQRVIAGRSMNATDTEGQNVDDVRIIFSAVELKTREPAFAPDVVAFEDGAWTVFRVEKWVLLGETHYRAVMTRNNLGAS